MGADPDRRDVRATRHGDRPRPHAGDSDAEKAVFAALDRLLARVPLRDISVSQIIAEAEISRATFYFYFSSKFAVVTGLIAVVMEELAEAIEPSRRDGNATESLHLRLQAMATVWAEHRAVLRAVAESWHAVPELQDMWLDMVESSTETLAREITQQRASGGNPVTPHHARQAAAVAIWATERTLYVAGLGVDQDLPSEADVAQLLLPMWTAVIHG